MSSQQMFGDDWTPPALASRGSSIDDLKEKGKELMQKSFKAGKDWYANFMHK